ncbi:hypothetical protein GW764_03805 [Candidatus Parcubacteria bacterium]|nr:hypothetical protein [Candidatus Parcubacteria bacterium]
MEKFNPNQEVKVDYGKEELKDPALTEIISALDDSNENAQKIKNLDNISLNCLLDVANRSEVPLEVFLPEIVENEQMSEEFFKLVKEYTEIDKRYNQTTNVPEREELTAQRKPIVSRFSEMFDLI